MTDELVVGAVAYSPNVVPIWEGMRDHFRGGAAQMDFVLFSNYERQVDALLDGRIDIAWNTNLAWVRTVGLTGGKCRALAMRDTDITFRTVFVAAAGSGFNGLEDLKDRTVALGSRDSGQARILPIYFLSQAGVDVDLLIHDSDVGKHGDTGRSELDCIRSVLDGDAAAAAIGITTWNALVGDRQAAGGIEAFWFSPEYCHCNFSALDSLDAEVSERWVSRLLAMRYDNPAHREIMEMEGVREWKLPELAGYESLFEAVAEQDIPLRW